MVKAEPLDAVDRAGILAFPGLQVVSAGPTTDPDRSEDKDSTHAIARKSY
jgi:hypothetical protein